LITLEVDHLMKEPVAPEFLRPAVMPRP
jgi:hypothetical protein